MQNASATGKHFRDSKAESITHGPWYIYGNRVAGPWLCRQKCQHLQVTVCVISTTCVVSFFEAVLLRYNSHWRQKEKGAAGDEIDSITDSMDMDLGKLWEIVEDRGAWCTAVRGVTKSRIWLSDWTTTTINSHITNFTHFKCTIFFLPDLQSFADSFIIAYFHLPPKFPCVHLESISVSTPSARQTKICLCLYRFSFSRYFLCVEAFPINGNV